MANWRGFGLLMAWWGDVEALLRRARWEGEYVWGDPCWWVGVHDMTVGVDYDAHWQQS